MKPILEIDVFGNKRWYLNGVLHKEDGPAIKWFWGAKEWYIHGKRHREDGPAIIYRDGSKEYWINHEHLTELEFFMKTGYCN